MNDYNNFSESYSNPRVKKLRSFAQSTYGIEAASYKGIAMKTLYFVAVFAAGMGAYFYIHNFFGGGAQAFSTEYTIFVGAIIATAIAGLVASFAPKTTAVTGSIYSAGMGYALTFMSMIYAMQWKGIIVEAVTLTLLTVAVLAVIYSKGVRVGSRMKTALITCLWVSIIGGLLFMLLAWLPVPNIHQHLRPPIVRTMPSHQLHKAGQDQPESSRSEEHTSELQSQR